MSEVIGEILPVALVVGLSPIPVMAVLLLLNTPRSLASGAAFLLGWSLAIAVVVLAVAAVVEVPEEGTAEDPRLWVALGKLVIGAAILALAFREWRKRPAPGIDPTVPSWMTSIERATPRRAATLGAALAALNPKHLPLFLAGGFAIGGRPLSFEAGALAVAVFVAVASAPVAAPVLGCLVAPRRVRAPLEALRGWLTLNNAMVMSLLFLVIGTSVVGSGLADL